MTATPRGKSIQLKDVVDVVNKQVTPLADNVSIHPMETSGYAVRHLPKVVNEQPVFMLTNPEPRMMTLQLQLPNMGFSAETLFARMTWGDRLIGMEIGKPRRIKFNSEYHSWFDHSPDKNAFGSQITMYVLSNFANSYFFKVKMFNSVDNICKVQVPGARDYMGAIEVTTYLQQLINKQLAPPMPVQPPVNLEIFLIQARSTLQLLRGLHLNFEELTKVLRETHHNQRLNGAAGRFRVLQASASNNNASTSNNNASASNNNNNTTNNNNDDISPCDDLVWPLDPPESDIDQNQCVVYVFTPVFGCATVKKLRVYFAGKQKPVRDNPQRVEYSILISGRGQIRHITYIYHLIWEILGRYQDRLLYSEDQHIRDVLAPKTMQLTMKIDDLLAGLDDDSDDDVDQLIDI